MAITYRLPFTKQSVSLQLNYKTSMVNYIKEPNRTIRSFRYKGFGRIDSECQIDIWLLGKEWYVLATDKGIGTSITNAAETVITRVYDCEIGNVMPKENLHFAETYGESIDEVLPEWNADGSECTKVSWKPAGGVWNTLVGIK